MEVSDYPTCERTYATLRIYPESLDPAEVTARLGIEPTEWQRRSESRRPGSRPAKLHGWFLTSEGALDSRDVRKHLDWLLARVRPRADALLALQASGCHMDVGCFWVSASGHGGPSVRPAQMRELAASTWSCGSTFIWGAAKMPNRALHLARPSDLFPDAYRLVIVAFGLAAGQVSFVLCLGGSMAATMAHPEFDAPALVDLAAAFARRRKAIHYHGKLFVSREVEADDGTERLNIDYASISPLGIRLRFSAWATGDWWFLTCQPRAGRNAGWLFKHELRGALAHRLADALVKSFEDSMLVG